MKLQIVQLTDWQSAVSENPQDRIFKGRWGNFGAWNNMD